MDPLAEYKKSVQERLDNADLVVAKAVTVNSKLELELENKRQELEQLREQLDALCGENDKLKTQLSQRDEDLEVVKDFFSHMVQVRIQTGSPYEDDQGLWFNISQGNDVVSIDYKLGFVKAGTELSENPGEKESENKDKNTNNTEIIYVPLLKELSLDELKLLQNKLPNYMFETLSFPLDALNQFYTKMSKCLNK